MFVLRSQPKGARFASFGLGLCIFTLMPTEIGYQDIASLLPLAPDYLGFRGALCAGARREQHLDLERIRTVRRAIGEASARVA